MALAFVPPFRLAVGRFPVTPFPRDTVSAVVAIDLVVVPLWYCRIPDRFQISPDAGVVGATPDGMFKLGRPVVEAAKVACPGNTTGLGRDMVQLPDPVIGLAPVTVS